jgi:chromosome segregation ATPase
LVKIQRELLYLKKKAEEAAGRVLNDDSVTNLQKQIDWFKNEALKLDQILENQKKELQKLKSRDLNLVEDRKFLRGQIKDAMKHNKLLQVAVKKTKQTNKSIREFLRQNQVKGMPPVARQGRVGA